jgi:hypothetical protein
MGPSSKLKKGGALARAGPASSIRTASILRSSCIMLCKEVSLSRLFTSCCRRLRRLHRA